MMYFTQIPSLNSSHLSLTLFILFNEYKFVDHVFAAHVFVAQFPSSIISASFDLYKSVQVLIYINQCKF